VQGASFFLFQCPPLPKLDDLELLNPALLNFKSNQGAHEVKTFPPARTGIDVQQAPLFIWHHFQDVGVTADVEIGRLGCQNIQYPFGVPAGVAADMGHKNIEAFYFKSQIFGKALTQGRCVYIAINGTKGFEGLQPFCHFHAADVPGMPDFIAGFEMGKNIFVENPVGIGHQPNAYHTLEDIFCFAAISKKTVHRRPS